MAIKTIEDSKALRKYGESLGREGLALRIIELCEEVAKEKHYINSIKAAGKIRALAMACKYDCYWDEKMTNGYEDEIHRAKQTTSHELEAL